MEGSKIQIIGTFVLDASVIIKWFSKEEFTDIALKFRSKFVEKEIEIVVPDLLLYEISNVLRYNKNFSRKDVKNAIETLIDMDISILVPSQDIINLAIDFAFRYDITFYDAFYIALAETLGVYFVTADRKLYESVARIPRVRFLTEFLE